LAQQLLEAGEHVVDVPLTLAARVRLLGSTKASKNDSNDALATAIAGLRHCGRRTVRVEDHTAVLRMLIDRYDDLVALRTQAACRLHVALRELIAGGASRRLGASRATKLLRNIHPQGAAGLERKRLAVELLADLRRPAPRHRHRQAPRQPGRHRVGHVAARAARCRPDRRGVHPGPRR
jgi:transposase